MVQFAKYHGLGNDFIMIDNRQSEVPLLSVEDCIRLCHRNFGIGADGVIFAFAGNGECDYVMKVVNSDGSVAQMCGNGLRCLAVFLQKLENCSVPSSFRIMTGAGLLIATLAADGNVTVDMGAPKLESGSIPTSLTDIVNQVDVLNHPFEITPVGMGNPHAVVFVDSLDSMVPSFSDIGPATSTHKSFPEGCNAEFVQVGIYLSV